MATTLDLQDPTDFLATGGQQQPDPYEQALVQSVLGLQQRQAPQVMGDMPSEQSSRLTQGAQFLATGQAASGNTAPAASLGQSAIPREDLIKQLAFGPTQEQAAAPAATNPLLTEPADLHGTTPEMPEEQISRGVSGSYGEDMWTTLRKQEMDRMKENAESGDSTGLVRATQVASGMAVGALEWAGGFAGSLGSAAAARIFGDMDSREAIQFGQEFTHELIQYAKSSLPQGVQNYLGNPEDPRAQELLQGVGSLIDSTVGWAGRKAAQVIGGVMDYAGAADPTGDTYNKFMAEAKPWMEYLGQFGTEFAAFGVLGKVGKYVGAKVRRGELPPETAAADGVAADRALADRVETDFNPREAAEKIVPEIKAADAELAEIKAQVNSQLRDQNISAGRARGERWTQLYQQALDLRDSGELLNTNAAWELRKQGVAEADIPQRILANIAERHQANAVNQRALESKQGDVLAELTRATDHALAAIGDGTLKPDFVGQGKDVISGAEVPYTTRSQAYIDAVKKASTGEGLYQLKMVPNTKSFVLEQIEKPGRVISPVKSEAYSHKAAARQKALLEDKGIYTRLVEQGEGFVLEVTGYSREGAKARISELKGVAPEEIAKTAETDALVRRAGRRRIEQLAKVQPELAAVAEKVKAAETVANVQVPLAERPRGNGLLKEWPPEWGIETGWAKEATIRPTERIQAVETPTGERAYGVPAERVAKLDQLIQAAMDTGAMPSPKRLAQGAGIPLEVVESYLKQNQLQDLFSGPTELFSGLPVSKELRDRFNSLLLGRASDQPVIINMHAGLPISKATAQRINEMALEMGQGVAVFLRNRGYDEAATNRITSAVEKLVADSPAEVARRKYLDTPRNRKQLMDSVQLLAESQGLLSSKTTKTGRALNQFLGKEFVEELTSGKYDLGLPLADVMKMMRDKEVLRVKKSDVSDSGFKDFVRDQLGKEWSGELEFKDLQTLHRALLNRVEIEGDFVIKQKKGMLPITDKDLAVVGGLKGVEGQRMLEGGIWNADRIDRLAPGFSDRFYWNFQRKWNKSAQRFLQDKLEIDGMEKELGLKRADYENVGRYAIWQQPEGRAYLSKIGVTEAPKLSGVQRQFYDYMRAKYESLFNELNRARAASGLEPLTYVENYFTFFREMADATRNGNDFLRSSAKSLDAQMARSRQTVFKEAKERVVSSELPIARNAKSVFERYLMDAYRHIELTPELARARQMIDSRYYRDAVIKEHGAEAWPTTVADSASLFLREANPDMYSALNKYINYVAGMPVEGAFPKLNKFATAMSRNLAFSILAWNVGSVMRQLGTWRHSLFETSMRDMTVGAAKALGNFVAPEAGTRFGEGRFVRGARARSDVLTTRSFDVMAEFLLGNLEGKRTTGSILGFLQDKAGRAGIKPLQFMDEVAATVTWFAAENKGKRLGLEGKELTKYADQAVVRTQGSGSRIETPPAMRDPVYRAAMLFQTYVLNDWSYLTKKVLGYKTDMPTLTKVKNVMYYVAVTTAMSTVYELMGIRSPFPTPLTTINESLNKEPDNTGLALLRGAMELAEPIPVIGGAVRYGSPLGGPFVGTAAQITGALHGDYSAPPIAVSAAKLAGVPGANAFYRGYRAIAQDTDTAIAGRNASTRTAASRPQVYRPSRLRSSSGR